MPYATDTDVATFMGVTTTDLPTDIARIIDRAGELIDHATMNRIDTEHTEHAKQSTCAQIEYWLQAVGEQTDIRGTVKKYSIGSFSIDFGDKMPELAPRARRILWNAGLLNRSVKRW